MNRRHFCKLSAAWLATPSFYSASASDQSPTSVIIIGAGVAGLSAAYFLKQRGVKATVIEGSDRIGGRILTQRNSWGCLEFGANWIHGSQKNPLFHFCKENKIDTLPTPENVKDDFVYRIDKSQVTSKFYQEKFRLFKKIESEIIGKSKIKNQSLATALSNAIRKNRIEVVDQKWLDFLFKIYVEENYGATLPELSAEQFGSSSWFSGGDYILPQGYDKVPLALSQGLNIKLKHPANRIEKLTNGDFQVSFEKAPPMVCQHVIVTIPLSLLQRQAITFIPPLPSRKTKSIQAVGFGQFTKIFVRLNPTKVKQLKTHPTWIKVLGSESQRGFQFFNLPHYSESDVLVGIAVAEEATLVENMSVDKLSSYVLSRAPFLEKKDIIAIETTQWGKNKWAHGSYSYPKVGGRESDFDEIGKSIDRLHFAGEACQSDVYGTVEAAFLSGQRAAEKIR